MRGYVAVTDGDWYRFLRGLAGIDEVNFWQPGGERAFARLEVGQPFLFKLHYPEHFIVGGGFFRHTSILPCSLAWDAFGEKNGAPSFTEMRRRIEKYRRVPADPHAEYKIGCIILVDPFFLEERDWIRPPEDFARTIVQGKTYDLTTPVGRMLWESVIAKLKSQPSWSVQVAEAEPAMYGGPILVRPRLGQGTFRVLVTDTYRRRCAVTGEKALPVLQAAHIKPVAGRRGFQCRTSPWLRIAWHGTLSGRRRVGDEEDDELAAVLPGADEGARDPGARRGGAPSAACGSAPRPAAGATGTLANPARGSCWHERAQYLADRDQPAQNLTLGTLLRLAGALNYNVGITFQPRRAAGTARPASTAQLK